MKPLANTLGSDDIRHGPVSVLQIREFVFLTLLLTAVAVVSWPWMERLGLEHDEAHSLPAAVRLTVGSPERQPFPSGLYLFHRPLPFMTSPYIGAFDAYLYSIFFSTFGISVLVFRVANLVFSLLILTSAYVLIRHLQGPLAAVLTSVFLAADVEFLLHAPTNYGPVLVQMLCAILSVFFLMMWMQFTRERHLLGAAFLLGLGLTEKLTFVLFIGGLTISLGVVYAKPLCALLRNWKVLWAVPAFLFGCLPIVIYTVGNADIVFGFGRGSLGLPVDWVGAVPQRYFQFKMLLARQDTMAGILAAPLQVGRFSVLWWLLFLALVCTVTGAMLSRLRPTVRTYAPPRICVFFVVLCFAIVTLSALFPESGRIHHLMLTYPFAHCAAGVMVAWVLRFVWSAAPIVRCLGLIVVIVPILASVASTAVSMQWFTREVVKTGGRDYWSSAIFELSAWVNSKPRLHFVFPSWGLNPQVFALSGGKCSCREYFFPLLTRELDPSVTEEVQRLLRRRNSVFVFSRISPNYDLASGHVFALARELSLRPRLLKQFRHPHEGKLLYEAYSFGSLTDVTWRPAPIGSPFQVNMLDVSLVGRSSMVLRGHVDKNTGDHLLGISVPLEPFEKYCRFVAVSKKWDSFAGFGINISAENDQVLRRYERPFFWFPMIGPELSVEVGPDVYPDYFFYTDGERGIGSRCEIYAKVKSGSGLVEVSFSGLGTGSNR